MLEYVLGAAVFLFGVAAMIGIVFYVGSLIVHNTPPLRVVRFETRAIRRQVPWRLRWFKRLAGKQVRARSRKNRDGRIGNLVAIAGCWLGVVASASVTALLMALGLSGELRKLVDGDGLLLELGVFSGGAFAGGWAILRLWRRGRRLRATRRRLLAATASEVRAADPRSPVVMLRAFSDDGLQVPLFEEGAVPITLEDTLVGRLVKWGPVVAVGRPGERLPPIGAGREYVSGEWKQRVRQLLAEAGVVVVLIHRTPGLLWEIEQIFTLEREQRLVLVVPDVKPEELARRWEALRATVEACRPDLADGRLSLSLRGTLAVVFDAAQRPQRVLGWGRYRAYYRDAVANALWFLDAPDRARDVG